MKNIKMLAIAALLVAVAVTSYSVSGTYAKYTTSKTYTDSARVAKWGIGMTNEVNLFSSDYVDVKSVDGKDVVAPGTKGEYTFELTGAPETNYTLDVEVTGTDNIGQLVYTLDNVEYATMAELVAAIDALYDPAKVYAANVSSESRHTIGWYWTFEEDEANNTTDTTLGNKNVLDTVSLTVTINAVQSEETANVTTSTTTTTTVAAGN